MSKLLASFTDVRTGSRDPLFALKRTKYDRLLYKDLEVRELNRSVRAILVLKVV